MKRCADCSLVENDDLATCPGCGQARWLPEPPMIIDGRYEVTAKLGRGSMGVVYLAEDRGLERRVAVKVISPMYARDADMVARFKREAQALALIRDEHVVQVYSFGPFGKSFFFAMEYVDGKNLEKLVEEHTEHQTFVPTHRALTILRQVATGLGAVHAKQIVHRDLKPSNIVIEEDTGRPVLIDFGLAKKLDRSREARTMRSGTPSYMAPEQSANQVLESWTITPRTDIYSLGCMAFELLTGRPPFVAEAITELWDKHTGAQPPLLSAVRPQLAQLDDVIAKTLAKNPAERYESAEAFIAALEEAVMLWLGPDSGAAPPAPAPAPQSDDYLRALVLSDNAALREMAVTLSERALAPLAVRVSRTAVAEQALELFEREPPHLVIVDLDLPGLDGIDLLSRLRRLPLGSQARILVVSSKADHTLRWRFNVLGVRDYVAKPVDPLALSAAVREIGERSGWIKRGRT